MDIESDAFTTRPDLGSIVRRVHRHLDSSNFRLLARRGWRVDVAVLLAAYETERALADRAARNERARKRQFDQRFTDEEAQRFVREGKACVLRNLAQALQNPGTRQWLLEPGVAEAFLKEADRLEGLTIR